MADDTQVRIEHIEGRVGALEADVATINGRCEARSRLTDGINRRLDTLSVKVGASMEGVDAVGVSLDHLREDQKAARGEVAVLNGTLSDARRIIGAVAFVFGGKKRISGLVAFATTFFSLGAGYALADLVKTAIEAIKDLF